MYHGITDKKISRGSVENYDGKHVFVEKFEEQLKLLQKEHSGQQESNSLQNTLLQEHLSLKIPV